MRCCLLIPGALLQDQLAKLPQSTQLTAQQQADKAGKDRDARLMDNEACCRCCSCTAVIIAAAGAVAAAAAAAAAAATAAAAAPAGGQHSNENVLYPGWQPR